MYVKRVPDHLSVIVVSAKGLKPKKEGKGKFCVVFGIGSTKANSEPTESKDGCPVFNCEQEFTVPAISSVLSLKVLETQHDEVLGQVSVPITDVLSLSREHIKTYPLQPHKKKKNVTGDLNLITWVSKWKVVKEEDTNSEDSIKKSSAFSRIRGLLGSDKQKQDSNAVSYELGNNLASKKKAFSSCNDLSIFGGSSLVGLREDSSYPRSFGDKSKEVSRKPEVSGISPSEGPVSGGTRLVVRGSNLGQRREDVVGLFVCGSNILASLEYVSSSKLICTTKAWKPCTGNICVETQSGGRGTSLVQFSFIHSSDGEAKKCDGADDSGISVDGGSLRKTKDLDQVKVADDSPRGTMARGIFNLTNLVKRSDSFEGKTRSEIHSISPKEAPYNTRTKLTIRGSNLAISRLDVLKIVVCGLDCTDQLEFESPSKLVCFVGPASSPTSGNVVLETTSTGTCSSSAELKLLPEKKETERSANRDKHSNSATSVNSGPKIGFLETIKRQHFGSTSSSGDPASPSQTLEPGSRSTFPMAAKPPVLEVLPMVSRDETTKLKKDDLVTVLEKRLMDCGREIEDLTDKNRVLTEECKRLGDYMKLIVTRALATCPQILSVEMPSSQIFPPNMGF